MSRAPVEITVSSIREALWHAVGHADPARGPSVLAGRLFHQTMAGLLDRQGSGWQRVLDDRNLQDAAGLRRHAYEKILGPLLHASEAALKNSGQEALWLWQAVGHACEWLCGVLAAARDLHWIRFDPASGLWHGADRLLASEQPVAADFHRPGWPATLRIHGVADAVLRDPASGRWCCIEFKLGQRAEDIDWCQAALYHLLLQDGHSGDLAVVRFTPERKEQVLTEAELTPAREALLDLAAKLAFGPGPATPPRHDPELGRRIVQTLADFGVPCALAGPPLAGPAFVRFPVRLARGVPVKRVINLAEDVGLSLKKPTPMISLEDGILAVDVSRAAEDRQIVGFDRVRQELPPLDPLHGSSWLPLGVDLNNQLRSIDLAAAESPHALVAGTTGSGKTEWLRTTLAALLLANTPETLRVVLVDPKRTAFSDMAGSPFLLGTHALLFPPEGSLLEALDGLIEEMEDRYRLFHRDGVDDLRAWRARTGQTKPRIACLVDEFADMMADARARKQLEERVVRLGAKARAAGIHLILATQHPDKNTVTGRLQANLSVRVCLKTTTYQQSLVALKQRGAERLLGRGDLLFSRGDRPVRLQAAYLSEAERRDIFGGKS